jgi:neamine transaminase/2'-deamino-2'-hydroxyneamine transaminase/neomycin C transaminase
MPHVAELHPKTSLLGQTPTCPRDAAGQARVFTHGEGAYLVDPGGNRWIDLDNGRGSVLLGHGDERVAEAVARAARGGVGVATCWSPLLDDVLERLSELLGGDVLGLFRTGTSALRAVASAVRAARAEQLGVERPLLLSAGYHGYDPMWWPDERPLTPNREGIVDFLFDLDVLDEWLRAPEQVAAVVISPDYIHLASDWYAAAGELARAAGVPVIADEVKTGFRYDARLAAAELEPAVWIAAKTLANGAPFAVAAGDATLLAEFDSISYTSFFDPTILAAASATLEQVATGEPQRRIGENGGRFLDHVRAALEEAALPIEVAGPPHLFQFVCASPEVETEFNAACAEERLLLYERDNQAPSVALQGDALDDACDRISRVCSSLAGRWPGLAVDDDARYAAAWYVMDGLPGLPRTREQTTAIVDGLWAE